MRTLRFLVAAALMLAAASALAAPPDPAIAGWERGQAYDKQKKASSMAADFQTFLKLAPNAPEAKLVQAVLAGMR